MPDADSTVLVLLMTIQGLRCSTGGLVRSKNMLSVADAGFLHRCIVTILWALYGTASHSTADRLLRRLPKAFLMGVTPDSKGRNVQCRRQHFGLVYVCFQMTSRRITPRSSSEPSPSA